jgi:hypothetical protein
LNNTLPFPILVIRDKQRNFQTSSDLFVGKTTDTVALV